MSDAEMTSGATGLVLEGISHTYGDVRAVEDVSLAVGPGELVCLLGPSGCGKSTILRLAAGLEELEVGVIRIDDRVVARGGDRGAAPPEQRSVGLMFQDYALFPHLTVRQNVAFGLTRGTSDAADRVARALTDVGLAHLADRYPHTLSGGQQQRIALIRALVPRPRLLLLDEPFSGLDQHRRQQMRRESLEVVRGAGVATLMVTHDPEEAMFLSDRIVVMNRGSVVQDSEPQTLYRHPADPFTARLFGSVNEFSGTALGGRVATPLGSAQTTLGDGEEALVIVRATDVQLAGDGAADARHGVVASSRPLGATSEVLIEIEGARVLARVPGLEPVKVGQAVSLSVAADRMHVFAAEAHAP